VARAAVARVVGERVVAKAAAERVEAREVIGVE